MLNFNGKIRQELKFTSPRNRAIICIRAKNGLYTISRLGIKKNDLHFWSTPLDYNKNDVCSAKLAYNNHLTSDKKRHINYSVFEIHTQ